jgi:phosphoserine aminotransferase
MTTLSSAKQTIKPSTGRVYNFNAGPSVLPDEVIRQIQQDIWNFQGTGMGIMEHSHRASYYDRVLHEAEASVRAIANVPSNYKILFMTGGSTSQNYIVPTNLLPKGRTADYLVTGYWAERSADDCRALGTVHVAASSVDRKHTYIPGDEQISYSADPAYIHFTSNNTIYGTQWHRLPPAPAGVPLVCDMCSDIYSRPVDVTKYGLIYASAQKNLGTTGTTIVIVREDLMERCEKSVPRMLQYRTFAKEVSMPNTPPAFAIYTVGLMAKWIIAQGGLKALEKHNAEKAKLIYDALDHTAVFWDAPVRKQDRSLMNIVFRARGGDAIDDRFMKEALTHGMDGLKGHRATGGMRASTYNAMSHEGCKALSEFIVDFAKRNG